MTSVALTAASTASPTSMSKSSTASREIKAVTTAGALISTLNSAVTSLVSPEDIVLSKERFEPSARNVFRGKITEIQDTGALVKLKVDVGKTFIVQITKRSFDEMRLNLGADVFLAFKALGVQLV
jgi:molybdopterin-binding protein